MKSNNGHEPEIIVNPAPQRTASNAPALIETADAPFVVIGDDKGGVVAVDLRNVTMLIYVPLQGMIVAFRQGSQFIANNAKREDWQKLVDLWKQSGGGAQ